MSRLTRDGTAESVSRDQISGTNADRQILIFPVQLTTSRTGNLTWLIHTLAICVTIHDVLRGECGLYTTERAIEHSYPDLCVSRVQQVRIYVVYIVLFAIS